jgi:toluene monooxygenase system protein E
LRIADILAIHERLDPFADAALNLVLKPMVDELLMKHATDLALANNDYLLGQIFYSLHEDCKWHWHWSEALVGTAVNQNPSNCIVLNKWIGEWQPRAVNAISALSSLFTPGRDSEPQNLVSRVVAYGNEFLKALNLEC